jgi:beta-lactamase superfamily II metal-dependent hydrolase
MEINLLDMGTVKYGDSILITQGQRCILIDSGHPSDSNSIRRQLTKLFKHDPPFDIDLLIVTHCHSDHIGCLPDLIKTEDIKPKKALFADEKLGFGAQLKNDDAIMDDSRTLMTALDEEDHSDLEDEELDQFIFDAATLQSKYHDMVDQLKSELGDNVLIYTGIEDGYEELEKEFKDFRLKILGPTKSHLEVCGKYLSKLKRKPQDAGDAILDGTADLDSIAKTYKTLMVNMNVDALGAQDMAGPGAAKNNESIVITVGEAGFKALLTGDMQFGETEVPGLQQHMDELLEIVNTNGPYDFIKFAHHTSYNGLGNNGEVLDQWLQQGTTLFAHSGGLNDTSHPDPNMLKILRSKKDELFFARTDRNGLITVSNKTKPEMLISKGDFNNFAPNRKASDEPSQAAPIITPALQVSTPAATLGQKNADLTAFVEITTKVPYDDVRVTLTIDIDKKKI